MSGQVTGPGQMGGLTFGGVTPSTEQTAAAAGQWNGLTVTVSNDQMSLISDAAEEMKHSFDQFVDREVAERKRQQNHNHRHYHVLLPPAAILGQVQQRIVERLRKLLDEVQATAQEPAAFHEAAEEAFADPTDRHAAMLWLEEKLDRENPSLARLAEREREQIEAEAGSEIQAGYNIAGVDADEVGGAESGRAMYRRVIIGHKDISSMLDDLISQFGESDLASNVQFLRKAVGADLSAAAPSTDKSELETMNNDLYQLRALGNFIREFDADLDAVRGKNGKPSLPLAGVGALRLFCKAKNERLIMLEPLRTILGLEEHRNPTYDVHALTLACKLAHELPHKLFADEDSRQNLLTAGQKMLDAAIDLEEDLLEG